MGWRTLGRSRPMVVKVVVASTQSLNLYVIMAATLLQAADAAAGAAGIRIPEE
jgi:hypothetical protein